MDGSAVKTPVRQRSASAETLKIQEQRSISGEVLKRTNPRSISGEALKRTNPRSISGEALKRTNPRSVSGEALKRTNPRSVSGEALKRANSRSVSGDVLKTKERSSVSARTLKTKKAQSTSSDKTEKKQSRLSRFLWYITLPVLVLVAWELVCKLQLVNTISMPAPETILLSAWQCILDGTLITNIVVSFLRVLEGFLLATVSAMALGIVCGLSQKAEKFTELLIQILKPIPPIAWIPLAILWFGIGETSKIYIIFLGAFFPVYLNTLAGIRSIDKRYIELGRVYEVDRRRLITKVVLPGALPQILTGIRVGLGNAWVCVVAAEMIAATQGIGYMLSNGRSMSRSDLVILAMLMIGIVGKVMDDLLKVISRKIVTWTKV